MSETPEPPVTQSPAERVFPPWSVETLVAWAVAYIALAYPIGYLYGWIIAHINVYSHLRIDVFIELLLRGSTAIAVHASAGLLFILFFSNRAGFSLRNIWGTYSVNPVNFGIALLMGSSLVVASSTVFTSVREQIIAPPVNPLHVDWRLLFATETVGLAIGSIAEEVFFRGLFYQAVRLKNTVFRAAIFSAFIFAGSHIYHFTNAPQLISDFLVGIFTAFLFERTHSLTPCVVLHFAANTTVLVIHYMSNY